MRNLCCLLVGAMLLSPRGLSAQEGELREAAFDATSVLAAAEWRQVDAAVDRAITYLARNQNRDGSFSAPDQFQPAITSLCVMAFISAGHHPGSGEYGEQLTRAIDYVLATQTRTGMFYGIRVEPYDTSGVWYDSRAYALYNHAIAGLMLTEAFGLTEGEQTDRIELAINRALNLSRKYQTEFKINKEDRGGWRYMMRNNRMDADLSVTSWQLMFFRSAKNAGFDVAKEYIDDAMTYVRGCYDPIEKRFWYCRHRRDARRSRAMSGAGILALSLGGEHNTDMARSAGDWILSQSFSPYRTSPNDPRDQYHYSVYYCTLAMFQLGGHYWESFYRPMVKTLLPRQSRSGGWPSENLRENLGPCYTTSLLTMVLTVADQLLPIYQR